MRYLLITVCLTIPLSAAAQHWCWDADLFEVEVIDADVQIYHYADLINCCPDPITFDVEVGDATIFVQENWEDLCDCYCCFDLKATLEDVPAGSWILRYTWFDYESYGWTVENFEIEVPDLGQGYVPSVGEILDSGCLDATSIPEGPEPPSSWSLLKVLYR